MTQVCLGGPSGPKPGVAETIIVGSFLIDLGLSIAAPELLPFAGLIESYQFLATSKCGTDPPAMPSSSDLNPINAIGGVLNPNFQTWLIAVKDLIDNYLWYQYCQCTTTVTPAPHYPNPPANQNTPTGGVGNSCSDSTAQTPALTLRAEDTTEQGYTAQLLPLATSAGDKQVGSQLFKNYVTVAPGQFTALHLKHSYVSGDTSNCSPFVWLIAWDDNDVEQINNFFAGVASGFPSNHADVSIPSNVTKIWITVAGPSSNNVCTGVVTRLEIVADCPTGPVTPDPQTKTMLQNIYGLLAQVYSLLPVRVPNYAAGVSHSSLSGDGSVSLQPATIALALTITTLPAVYGLIAGQPETFIDVGWVTPVTNEGPEAGIRITRSFQVIPLPEATSSVDYSLPPGEIVTIAELQAG